MTLDDATFLRFARDLNPGTLIGGDRVSSHEDMRENLLLIYGMVVGCKATRILEIGTNDGTSTLAFLKGAQDTGGHVTSIDESDVPIAEALVDRFGLRDRWTFRRGNSHAVLKDLIAEGRQFDIAFVDGDHSQAGCAEDVEDVCRMLRPGGLLLLHDAQMTISDAHRAEPGCGFTVHEMLHRTDWQGVVFPFGSGFSVFQRRAVALAPIEDGMRQLEAMRLSRGAPPLSDYRFERKA